MADALVERLREHGGHFDKGLRSIADGSVFREAADEIDRLSQALSEAEQEKERFRHWVIDGEDVPDHAAWRMQVWDQMVADRDAALAREERLREALPSDPKIYAGWNTGFVCRACGAVYVTVGSPARHEVTHKPGCFYLAAALASPPSPPTEGDNDA